MMKFCEPFKKGEAPHPFFEWISPELQADLPTSTSGLGERRGVPVACAFWSVLGLNPEKGGEEARRPSVRERRPGNT